MLALEEFKDAIREQGTGPCQGCHHAEYCAEARAACGDYAAWVMHGPVVSRLADGSPVYRPRLTGLRAPVPELADIIDLQSSDADPEAPGERRGEQRNSAVVIEALIAAGRAQHTGDPFELRAAPLADWLRDNGFRYYNKLVIDYRRWLLRHGARQVGPVAMKYMLNRAGLNVPPQIIRRHCDGPLAQPDAPPVKRKKKKKKAAPKGTQTLPFRGAEEAAVRAAIHMTEIEQYAFKAGSAYLANARVYSARQYHQWLKARGTPVGVRGLRWLIVNVAGVKDFTMQEAHAAQVTRL